MADRQLYKLHASICHTLANSTRLEIIDKLCAGEMSVTELTEALEVGQANLSQHLAIMRQRGIVTARREGLNVYYRLSNPKITQACDLMRQVLMEYLETAANVARGTASRDP